MKSGLKQEMTDGKGSHMIAEKQQAKSANIELLRIVSMIMILFLHLFGQGQVLTNAREGIVYYYVWIMEGICFVSVNCFMMITGYLMWNKQFRWKRLTALYIEIWFWTVVLTLGSVICGIQPFSWKLMISCLPIVSRNNWYVTAYFAVALISPVMNAAVRNMSKRNLRSVIIIMTVLFSAVPTVFCYVDQFNLFSGYSVLWFAFMYLTAAYIGKYGLSIGKTNRSLMMAGILLLPASKFVLRGLANRFDRLADYEQTLFAYNSVPVLIASIAFFVFFTGLDIRNAKIGKTITAVGGTTFGVFYTHSFFMFRDVLWIKLGSLKFIDSAVFIPYSAATVLAVFCVCSFLDRLRRKFFDAIGAGRLAAGTASKIPMLLYPESPDSDDDCRNTEDHQ